MEFPGESDLLAERAAIVATLETLTDEEFEHGTTLCSEWAPRDILSHLMGVDTGIFEYVKSKGNIGAANAVIVAKDRGKSRDRMMNRARHWAAHPAPLTRPASLYYLGDVAVHHQDILRGLGKERDIPHAASDAILREGLVLGGTKLLSHRIEPTDGGWAIGRGEVVRGTREVLGLWLTGREGLDAELDRGRATTAS
jgi:uncharacterized protein (TIGR03083 family)